MIKSAEPLPVEYIAQIGLPARSRDEPEPPPDITHKVVEATLTFVKYMSPQDHAAARKHNDRLRQPRLDFIRSRLRQDLFGYKSPPPWRPSAYSPRSAQERQLIQEYAFLWIATEPQPLPTHYFRTLSIDLSGMSPSFIKIHHAKKDKEFHQILDELDKIVEPYEKEP